MPAYGYWLDTWFNTFTYRGRTVFSNPLLLQKEEEHVMEAHKKSRYPIWALNRLKIKNNYVYNKPNNNKEDTILIGNTLH